MSSAGARYPAEYEADILLRDGSTAHLRPARPTDREAVEALYERLSEHGRLMRFHRSVHDLPEEILEPVLKPDYKTGLVLLAVHEERVIGLARYRRSGTRVGHADIAFTVEESHQHLGLATQLLYQLAVAARDQGVGVFEADVLAENEEMLDVLRDSGFVLASTLKAGTHHITFPIGEAPRPAYG
ncbi:MAG TPA: GNAT family N-acetyltransferase [Dehalococcoidia bacterium]